MQCNTIDIIINKAKKKKSMENKMLYLLILNTQAMENLRTKNN